MSFRRDDRDDQRQHTTADSPPMSRLFVICNKNQDENDFRDAFSKFGMIEEIWVVQDKYTGENKGNVVLMLAFLSNEFHYTTMLRFKELHTLNSVKLHLPLMLWKR